MFVSVRVDADDPVANPVSVTTEAACKLTLVAIVTLMMFATAATGVVWPIVLVVNVGNTTSMGLPPFVTPSKSAVFVDIDADEIDAVPDAAIYTVPAFC